MLIVRSVAAGLNSFVVSPDDMVSVVEGLQPSGVTGMMDGGGSGTSVEHGMRWDKSRGLDPLSPKPRSRHSVCKRRSYIGSPSQIRIIFPFFCSLLFSPPFFHDSFLMSDVTFHPRTFVGR